MTSADTGEMERDFHMACLFPFNKRPDLRIEMRAGEVLAKKANTAIKRQGRQNNHGQIQ